MEARCPKCDSTNFQLQEISVSGLDYQVHLVTCSNCGTSIGVAEPNSMDIGNQIQDLKNQLDLVSQRIDQTTSNQEYNVIHKINELETQLTNIRYQLRSN